MVGVAAVVDEVVVLDVLDVLDVLEVLEVLEVLVLDVDEVGAPLVVVVPSSQWASGYQKPRASSAQPPPQKRYIGEMQTGKQTGAVK